MEVQPRMIGLLMVIKFVDAGNDADKLTLLIIDVNDEDVDVD